MDGTPDHCPAPDTGEAAATRSAASREPATPHTVADALVLLALALRSGMGQREALDCVARTCDGAVSGQLRAVSAALRWGRLRGGGRTRRRCGDRLPSRGRSLRWTGAGPAQLVEDASWRLRDREDRRLEAAAPAPVSGFVPALGGSVPACSLRTSVIPVVLALGQRESWRREGTRVPCSTRRHGVLGARVQVGVGTAPAERGGRQ